MVVTTTLLITINRYHSVFITLVPIKKENTMQTSQEFLETYICKTGESVRKINEDEWEIQKWTARTYRALGIVRISAEFDISPSEDILKLGLKPNSKKQSLPLSDSAVQKALMKGWIIREIRFAKDGRTPVSDVIIYISFFLVTAKN